MQGDLIVQPDQGEGAVTITETGYAKRTKTEIKRETLEVVYDEV